MRRLALVTVIIACGRAAPSAGPDAGAPKRGPEIGCADGTREGLTDPDVAACGGTFTGFIDGEHAGRLCATGWRVCRGDDGVVARIGLAGATSFSGCFAFDAAHDCS